MTEPTHQVVIMDVSCFRREATQGGQEEGKIERIAALTAVFCKAHMATSRHNSLLVIAIHGTGFTILHPPPKGNEDQDFDDDLLACLENSLPPSVENSPRATYMAQGLSRALCSINRRIQANIREKSKILCLQLSLDDSSNYNAMMNSIFSAQKFGVPVDAVIFSSTDSSFMQQASLLTGGIYSKPLDYNDALQLLLMHYLPCTTARKILRPPLQTAVDFKASCTCHNEPVDFTFMCSVCLSLFCPEAMSDETCEICSTRIRRASAFPRPFSSK